MDKENKELLENLLLILHTFLILVSIGGLILAFYSNDLFNLVFLMVMITLNVFGMNLILSKKWKEHIKRSEERYDPEQI